MLIVASTSLESRRIVHQLNQHTSSLSMTSLIIVELLIYCFISLLLCKTMSPTLPNNRFSHLSVKL